MARVLLVLALLLVAGAAAAQPGAPADSGRALQLGREALDLFGHGDWGPAFDRFSAADRAAHSPVFVLYMARSRRGGGQLLAARELFASVVAEPVPAGAPEPWQKAHDDAAKELAALEGRIPAVILALRGAPPEDAVVTLDGAPVSAAALRTLIRVDPGAHTIEARARDRLPATETVRLAGGDEPRRIELVLAAPTAPPPAKIPAPIAPIAPIAPARGSLVPGAILLGTGAAGLVTGVITGVIAKGRAGEVLDNCTADGHCLVIDKEKGEGAQRLATISTVSLVAGGALAATGVVLILVRPGGGSSAPAAALVPGPGSLRLVGAF